MIETEINKLIEEILNDSYIYYKEYDYNIIELLHRIKDRFSYALRPYGDGYSYIDNKNKEISFKTKIDTDTDKINYRFTSRLLTYAEKKKKNILDLLFSHTCLLVVTNNIGKYSCYFNKLLELKIFDKFNQIGTAYYFNYDYIVENFISLSPNKIVKLIELHDLINKYNDMKNKTLDVPNNNDEYIIITKQYNKEESIIKKSEIVNINYNYTYNVADIFLTNNTKIQFKLNEDEYNSLKNKLLNNDCRNNI